MYPVLFHIYLIYNMLWRILNHLQGDKYKGIYTLLHNGMITQYLNIHLFTSLKMAQYEPKHVADMVNLK